METCEHRELLSYEQYYYTLLSAERTRRLRHVVRCAIAHFAAFVHLFPRVPSK